jgi:hypothetical protein
MKKKQRVGPKKKSRNVIGIEDLAPRKALVGGSGKLLFGERPDRSVAESSAAETESKERRD